MRLGTCYLDLPTPWSAARDRKKVSCEAPNTSDANIHEQG